MPALSYWMMFRLKDDHGIVPSSYALSCRRLGPCFLSPPVSVHAEMQPPALCFPVVRFASDEEETPTSQPCTPQPGSDSIDQGSLVISRNNSAPNNAAASATSDRALSATPAVDDAAQGPGPGSSQSAFSAVFRRYLTATAVPPATPAYAAAAPDISPESCSHGPQQQQQTGSGGGGGNVSGVSTVFCSTATDRGDGGVAAALSWPEEEKRGENAADVARPAITRRPGLLGLFRGGSGNGSGEADTARGARERTGSLQNPGWRARVWATLSSARGGAGASNPLAGGVEEAAAGVPSSDIVSVQRFSEERSQIGADRRGAGTSSSAGSSLQGRGEDRVTVESMSHRRRTGRRLAGNRGRRCDGDSRASSGPAVRDGGGRNNGGGVAARSGCDGGGAGAPAGVVGSGTWAENDGGRATTGHSWVPEIVAADAAVGAVPAGNARGGRSSCSGGDGEAGGARREAAEAAVRTTAGHAAAGRGDITDSPAACAEFLTGDNVVAAAAHTNLVMPPVSQHHPEGLKSSDAGNETGAAGGGERRVEVRGGSEGGVSPLGETISNSPALPRARVLWRAFSEVDHDTITENHRLAGLRHLARFAPGPGIENPPMCYVPPQG